MPISHRRCSPAPSLQDKLRGTAGANNAHSLHTAREGARTIRFGAKSNAPLIPRTFKRGLENWPTAPYFLEPALGALAPPIPTPATDISDTPAVRGRPILTRKGTPSACKARSGPWRPQIHAPGLLIPLASPQSRRTVEPENRGFPLGAAPGIIAGNASAPSSRQTRLTITQRSAS